MGNGGRLEAFSYLTPDKAAAYRAVMRIFLDAKERFLLHLRPSDVQNALEGGIELDGVQALLTQLVEWGNLRADPDTAEVATVEEFYRARFLYQLTAEGEAAERAVARFEELLVTPGELQTTALADIRGQLRELVLLARDDDLDDARVHLTLRLLVDRFEELTDRARTFIAGLQRSVELHGIDLEAFVAYKDRLIDYLERFIGDLVVAQAEIAQLLAEVEAAGMDRLLAAAADRDLADARAGVLREELAAPVLVLNLVGDGDSLCDQTADPSRPLDRFRGLVGGGRQVTESLGKPISDWAAHGPRRQ